MKPPTAGDPVMEEIMAGLASCLCRVLVEAGRPACCCQWYEGDHRPPMDGCDCECPPDGKGDTPPGQGIAWVREISRNNTAPTQARRGFGSDCAIPPERWRITVELGVYRCAPTGDAESGPTCQEHTNAAANGAWDAALLEYAVACCDVLDGRQVVLQDASPVGPTGGCVGRILTITLNKSRAKVTGPR